MTMGLRADIYESKAIGNCSAGGISSRCKSVTVVKAFGQNVEGPSEPSEDAPAVVIQDGPLGSVNAVPASQEQPGEWSPERPSHMVGPMSGGTFISTSDARFSDLLEGRLQYPAAVSLHDRFETPAQYASYD